MMLNPFRILVAITAVAIIGIVAKQAKESWDKTKIPKG